MRTEYTNIFKRDNGHGYSLEVSLLALEPQRSHTFKNLFEIKGSFQGRIEMRRFFFAKR